MLQHSDDVSHSLTWLPLVFSADTLQRAIISDHWCVKHYLYLMQWWPLVPAADSLPHAIHCGHGSVMPSLLPHVITITDVSFTSCT
jgi:hypothetical protein